MKLLDSTLHAKLEGSVGMSQENFKIVISGTESGVLVCVWYVAHVCMWVCVCVCLCVCVCVCVNELMS